MNQTTQKPNNQFYLFVAGLILFSIIASFGWIKLQYGFNFIDEGYHMTKSWRLTVGDHFFDDQYMAIVRPFTLINSIVFRINPDITLLGFRQLQFVLTLTTLLLFSSTIYIVNKEYWYFPFIFSVFAFTGLDPVGMISNLNYFTWPHFFITLALGCLIFALTVTNKILKNILLLISGCFLWLISLSLLHLSVIILYPFILYFLSKTLRFKHFPLDLKDCFLLSGPFCIGWLGFVVIYQKTFFTTVISSLTFFLSLSTYSPERLASFNFWPFVHIAIAALFLLIFLFLVRAFPPKASIASFPIISLLVYIVIETSCFGLVQPYYNGWFARPMWFAAFLIGFYVIFVIGFTKKYLLKENISKNDELISVLLIPVLLLSVASSIFSTNGPLTFLYSSIPGVAGLAIYFLHHATIQEKKFPHKLLVLISIITPIYYSTIYHDWKFTFFDVTPDQMNVTIEKGFGKGIKTNALYGKLYEWVGNNAAVFTKPDDFQLSYCVSSMTHMITNLRPSLDDTFISWEIPGSHYQKAIELMIKKGREPKIAFIFERMPILIPVSVEKGTVAFPGKQFDFMSSQDPISNYVKTHMTPEGMFKISDDHIIRCYVNNNLPKNQKTGTNL